jgi:hypothetical protein
LIWTKHRAENLNDWRKRNKKEQFMIHIKYRIGVLTLR